MTLYDLREQAGILTLTAFSHEDKSSQTQYKIKVESIMSTLFEPSASFRAPYSTTQAPSMADTLPSINFGFEELRDRMAKFTVKFDTFIEAGRKRILEERNQFRMNIAELKGGIKYSKRSNQA